MNLSYYKTPYKYIYILKRPRKHNLNRFMWSYYAALIYYEYQSGENLNYTVYIYMYIYLPGGPGGPGGPSNTPVANGSPFKDVVIPRSPLSPLSPCRE